MMESNVDLESPLLSIANRGSTRAVEQRRDEAGQARGEFDEEEVTSPRSGAWKFRYRKYLADNLFAEADHHTEGKREYNRRQRETLAGFAEVDSIKTFGPNSESVVNTVSQARDKFAVNLSNSMNIILLIVKVYASVQSQSLAVIASTLDSLLDFLAGLVLWFAHSSMQRKNRYKYPIGKLRIQPVGIVVFAATMATLGVQVLLAGVEQLSAGDTGKRLSVNQRIWLILIMGSATVIKLGLYMYCRSFDNDIVLAYSQDHFFDVVTNLAGLAAALLADHFYWWIDPAGAIFLAVYTIINWSKTVLENAVSLVGQSAPAQILHKLTYMAFNHDPRIQRIDTVRAYSFGNFYFAEVDIELPEDMPLKEAHEIGESLQNKMESLPEVERAFVHLDYECEHKPEHFAIDFKHPSS